MAHETPIRVRTFITGATGDTLKVKAKVAGAKFAVKIGAVYVLENQLQHYLSETNTTVDDIVHEDLLAFLEHYYNANTWSAERTALPLGDFIDQTFGIDWFDHKLTTEEIKSYWGDGPVGDWTGSFLSHVNSMSFYEVLGYTAFVGVLGLGMHVLGKRLLNVHNRQLAEDKAGMK